MIYEQAPFWGAPSYVEPVYQAWPTAPRTAPAPVTVAAPAPQDTATATPVQNHPWGAIPYDIDNDGEVDVWAQPGQPIIIHTTKAKDDETEDADNSTDTSACENKDSRRRYLATDSVTVGDATTDEKKSSPVTPTKSEPAKEEPAKEEPKKEEPKEEEKEDNTEELQEKIETLDDLSLIHI